jgi:regulator of sirC expression with transglutaminase-like and TPR domain
MDDLASFQQLAEGDEGRLDLGRAALAIARIEHPTLSVELEVARLDALAARCAVGDTGDPQAALERLLAFLFEEERFRGNAEEYYDPRNSCLNDVLDRKLGIPITLSLVTMEVGRRVGVDVDGVSLPGHFIVSANLGARRCP